MLDFFGKLRDAEGPDTRIGAAGFCWGGLYAIQLTHDVEKSTAGYGLVDAVFTAHPSFVTIPADIERVTKPLSVSIGDVDIALPLTQARQMKNVLDGKNESKYEVVILEGAKHGFAIRGNPEDEEQMKLAQIAEDQAVDWFLRWLVK